jgi:predicted GNAT family acetyltransferase
MQVDARVIRAGQSLAERRAFVETVTPFMARDEAANNQPLAIANQLQRGRMANAEVQLLRAVPIDGGEGPQDTLSVLLRTAPYNAVIATGGEFAHRVVLLEDLLARGVALPGFTGLAQDAAQAADWWAARTGQTTRVATRLGVFRLTEVIDKPRAPGRLRPARADERDMVVQWFVGFNEATRDALRDPVETWESFNQGDFRRLYIWEVDGEPVSLAGISGQTPNGRRIGPVYTPPEARRQGYAEALVARLSRSILDSGSRFCFLYTDLDFPTSNHVYRDVGFEQVGEAAEIVFV